MFAQTRVLAAGGFLGPVAFVAGWVIGGALASDYSAIDDAISELAAVGASTRLLMTTAFVAYAIGAGAYAVALHRIQRGWAWLAAAVSAAATFGVACTPLDWSDRVDTLHGVFAGIGYVALAAVPWLSIPYLAARRWRVFAMVVGGIAGVCLAATVAGPAHGFFQRAGLTTGDIWLVSTALVLVRSGTLARA